MIGYVTEQQLTDYTDARGITLTASASVLLTKALDWVELQSYQGSKTDSAQALQWPRTGVYIDGVEVDSATVPALVQELQMRVAIDIDQGTDPNAVRAQTVKQETVSGAVSVTYADGSATASISRQVQAILAKLNGGRNQWQFGVTRG